MDAGTAFANVTWSSLPSASDNVDVNITDSVVCEDDLGNVVISGRAHTAGLTTVTCKAHDTALNEGSCQFNITVVGTFPFDNFFFVVEFHVFLFIHIQSILVFQTSCLLKD